MITMKRAKKKKFVRYLKKNWSRAAIWLLGVIVGLMFTKACNWLIPDNPVVVKEYADTVRVVHSMGSIPADSDSIIRNQIERNIRDMELLSKYEEQKAKHHKILKNGANACRIIVGNPYPNSRGYTVDKANTFCLIELKHNSPFIDILFHFLREEDVNLLNTLCVKIYKEDKKEKSNYLILDQNYEHQKGKEEQLIRIVDDFSSGKYTIDAGFMLKDDREKEYPTFYRKTFSFTR